MQQEIFFDAITAADVAQHLENIERLRGAVEQFNQHQTALNSIMLTVGRMNGCNPEATIQLNAAKTGVLITAPAISAEAAEPSAAGGKSK